MKTSIRMGKSNFYGDSIFTYGLSRSGYFNMRESEELAKYGNTFEGLWDGSLSPINEEEKQFINAMKSADESELYSVYLWKKYLAALDKSRVHHGFSMSKGRAEDASSDEQSFA